MEFLAFSRDDPEHVRLQPSRGLTSTVLRGGAAGQRIPGVPGPAKEEVMMVLRGWRETLRARTQPTRARLNLEGLEDRLAPASLTMELRALPLPVPSQGLWQAIPARVVTQGDVIPTYQVKMVVTDSFGD